jgi:hypothetical protein
MEIPIYRQCICGALTVGLVVGSVVTETCEHGKNASACPMPRVEYIHTDYPEPQGPAVARATYVLGTGTNDRSVELTGVRFHTGIGNLTAQASAITSASGTLS